MTTEYYIVIPARMASQRLPGKPLADVAGKPLIQRVWECAQRSGARQVVVATDDEQIMNAATGFGADCLMTRNDHLSGTDRIAECAQARGWPDEAIIVNLQGDEPLMPPACLNQVASLLEADPQAQAASLYALTSESEEIVNPNVVKVVTQAQGRALYFSRSPVPAARDHASIEAATERGCTWKRHIGLYAYRAAALARIAKLEPTPLEQLERLEQLRILETGGAIAMAQAVEPVPAGVDTLHDLERVRSAFE